MGVLINLFLSIALADTAPVYEQLALDHFFNNVISQKYPDLKSVELATQTDTSSGIEFISNCTQWDEKTRKEVRSRSTQAAKELKRPQSSIPIRKIRSQSNRLKIYVSLSRKVGDTYFVEVAAYRKLRFVDHFIYQFDSDGRLSNTCEGNEII